MFGSNILEVAIGLVFVYLLFGLLCSTINEQIIVRFFALRARTLADGIKNMLGNDELMKQLYENPLIKGLSQPTMSGKARKPSYIPTKTFATALVDVIQTYQDTPGAANSPIPEALVLLMKQANNDPAQMLTSIENWFDNTMDRVSGWYQRRVQLIILLLGLVIVVGLNVDTISLISSLSTDTVIRATIVSAAQGAASTQANATLATLQKNIEQIQPVIGWSPAALPTDFWGWVLKVVGLLATTFAVSLGAPFWFDVLNKFITFRSSGPPPPTTSNAE